MAQGNYDHPAYVTRQTFTLKTTAGANGTSVGPAFPWDVNIHNVSASVVTAGTSAGATVFLLAGTATVAGSTVTLSTNTAQSVSTSGNAAVKVTAGTPINIKNGTDATCVAFVTAEFNLAPDTGTWLGNE